MEIRSTLTNRSGQTLDVMYKEDDPMKDLDVKILQGVHAFCFCGEKLVVVYAENKKYWTPPGGGIEPGETYEEAVVREVKEETNMKVVKQQIIGYQDIYEPDRVIRQTRSVCIVEPVGEFIIPPQYPGRKPVGWSCFQNLLFRYKVVEWNSKNKATVYIIANTT